MEALSETWIWVLFGVTILLGIILTVVYYFSRYYFKTSRDDKEVISKLLSEEESEPLISSAPSDQKEVEKIEDAVKPKDVVSPKSIAKPKELKEALYNTREGLWGRIKGVFANKIGVNQEDLDSLEEILYTSDLGPQTVQKLVETLSQNLSTEEKQDVERLRGAIKSEMQKIFEGCSSGVKSLVESVRSQNKPAIIMVVGVNGAGKTTSIGKLANLFASKGLKTMVIAGDTFRAAAREQLDVWGHRANVEIFNPGNVQDPSAVAFDGCSSAKANGFDVAIIDTAGRLHTQANLMEELKKMKRVVQKVLPEAPQEILIVLDANSGQNALVQAKMFDEALDLSGVILTKLDGTAKGGVALGLAYELDLPIRMIGIGEGIEDLRDFEHKEFVDSII